MLSTAPRPAPSVANSSGPNPSRKPANDSLKDCPKFEADPNDMLEAHWMSRCLQAVADPDEQTIEVTYTPDFKNGECRQLDKMMFPLDATDPAKAMAASLRREAIKLLDIATAVESHGPAVAQAVGEASAGASGTWIDLMRSPLPLRHLGRILGRTLVDPGSDEFADTMPFPPD